MSGISQWLNNPWDVTNFQRKQYFFLVETEYVIYGLKMYGTFSTAFAGVERLLMLSFMYKSYLVNYLFASRYWPLAWQLSRCRQRSCPRTPAPGGRVPAPTPGCIQAWPPDTPCGLGCSPGNQLYNPPFPFLKQPIGCRKCFPVRFGLESMQCSGSLWVFRSLYIVYLLCNFWTTF